MPSLNRNGVRQNVARAKADVHSNTKQPENETTNERRVESAGAQDTTNPFIVVGRSRVVQQVERRVFEKNRSESLHKEESRRYVNSNIYSLLSNDGPGSMRKITREQLRKLRRDDTRRLT